MTIMETLAPWEGQDELPYTDLARSLGLGRGESEHIIREGMIKPLPKTGKKHYLTRDEAIMFVIAAAIAAVAGITVIAVLRQFRATGATISTASVTIPIKGL